MRGNKHHLPLKHWIHFLRSSLWPPTSNILYRYKCKHGKCCHHVEKMYMYSWFVFISSAVDYLCKKLLPSTLFTYWKLTLSTWNLVSKIPEVSTLHLSKSWWTGVTNVTTRLLCARLEWQTWRNTHKIQFQHMEYVDNILNFKVKNNRI